MDKKDMVADAAPANSISDLIRLTARPAPQAEPASPEARALGVELYVGQVNGNEWTCAYTPWQGQTQIIRFCSSPEAAALLGLGAVGFVNASQKLAAIDKAPAHQFDAAGNVKPEATLLEQQAVRALNMVKAWRDSDGNETFPHEARELIDAVLLMAEQRRTGLMAAAGIAS